MAQRVSGYERIPAELYQTPAHVTLSLLSVYRVVGPVLEPACGEGKIVSVLRGAGISCVGTDINDYGSMWQSGQGDFLKYRSAAGYQTIMTNPPYGAERRGALALAFIEHALELTREVQGQVVMLLAADYDHAGNRRHLFRDHPAFKHRIALSRRIKWFDPPPGQKSSGPSTYHAWFVWDWMHKGGATVLYA